jgi:hypothetical protein
MRTIEEGDLQVLFELYLPPCAPPDEFAEALKRRVLTEVGKLRQSSLEQHAQSPYRPEANTRGSRNTPDGFSRPSLTKTPPPRNKNSVQQGKARWLDSLFHQRYDHAL